MIDAKQLLNALQKRVTLLEDDLRARCNAQAEVDAPLKADYEAARAKGRTGLTYNAWRDEELTQIAVAWILAGVFVRFLEDNELIDVPFFAGGNAARHQRAQDEHSLFFRQHPTASEREYFEHVFNTVGKLPGMKDFFDRRHNPLWRVGPTADAAKALLEFWRKTDPDTGRIVQDFTDPRVPAKSEYRMPKSETSPKPETRKDDDADADVPLSAFSLQPSAFPDPTRFLGDLYQDLSEAARKKFALLQTPVFVEEFILDRTLTPAIQIFGYKAVRMIDPTCGSGHFCLGGFDRLFRLWQQENTGENLRVLAQRALDGVYGVDLNPYAIAIARFRLLLAALRVSGINKLKDAPDFRINLAAGDSLLHGSRFREYEGEHALQQTFGGDEMFRDELKHFYESEDREELHRILGQQYHVVVGNPPYITVKDKALDQAYRTRFDSAHRAYSLAVPFMERFFDLAFKGDGKGHKPAGYVGMITANSFMKREFGKKLIEEFIPKWDLTHIVDTSGAYIPGHGTPTVILFGKHQPPVVQTIRTVMGIKAEPAAPEDPARGYVWTAILRQLDDVDSQSEFVSVADSDRKTFHKHPWTTGGGGASELLNEVVSRCAEKLGNSGELGIAGWPGIDEIMVFDYSAARRFSFEAAALRPFVAGENVRDWLVDFTDWVIVPYSENGGLLTDASIPRIVRFIWPHRFVLNSRVLVSGETIGETGMPPWAWVRWNHKRVNSSPKFCFAFVATHNHFALERGGNAFNRSAPIMKFPADLTEESQLSLLGLLNCSTGCFWMKQVLFPKGGSGMGRGFQNEAWEGRLEFDNTKLDRFPIAQTGLVELPRDLDRMAHELKLHTPVAVLAAFGNHTRAALDAAKQRWTETLQRMITLQEELDWECYRLYGLASESVISEPVISARRSEGAPLNTDSLFTDYFPPLRLGERAFEIVMARKLAAGKLRTTWFERHGSTPITELPAHWPQPYRELVERRIALMESDRNIALIEQPEYKRRWNVEPWDEQLERALREWLLNRLEQYFFGGERMMEKTTDGTDSTDKGPESQSIRDIREIRGSFIAGQQPALVSTNQLAAVVETDADFLRVAEIYSGGPGFSISKLVHELVEAESVPFLPFQRYKDTGLRKRQDWEHVWDLQREEDAIDAQEKVDEPSITEVERKTRKQRADARKKNETGDIPVPPKYASPDFKKSNWWKLRGKLDVPKERWIIYPGAERDGDPSPVIAWAGWDHLQQAKALAGYYVDANTNLGWTPEKLQPLLAGLVDLLPWLKQWHNEFDPEVTSGLGDYFAGFLDEEARKQGAPVEALTQMRFRKPG